jgi:hypothetical protein
VKVASSSLSAGRGEVQRWRRGGTGERGRGGGAGERGRCGGAGEGQMRWRHSREKARLEERRLLLAPTAARGELPFGVEPLMRKDEKDRIR